jgi:hypothetical protein
MTRNCAQCGASFILTADKPGRITDCLDCSDDVARVQAGQSADGTGVVDGLLRRGSYPIGYQAVTPGYRGNLDPHPLDRLRR